MNKIKLVLTDVDHTLLDYEKNVSDDNLNEIKRIESEGIKFGIASGRTVFNIMRTLPEWGLEKHAQYIIGSNGGEVYDVENDELELSFPLRKDIILEIYNKYKDLDLNLAICVYDDDILTTNNSNDAYEERLKQSGLKKKVVNFTEYISRDYPKIIVLATPDDIDKLLDYYNENDLNNGKYRMFKSQDIIAEIVDPNLSKSFGVQKIADKLNLNRNEVMTIGDNNNDIEMIRDYVGVAMSNATDTVKEVATYETLSCQESGVAHILKKLV